MNVVGKRIPPEFFDRARLIAAEERAKAMAAFFARLFRPRQPFVDIHFRFHRGGLWRGI